MAAKKDKPPTALGDDAQPPRTRAQARLDETNLDKFQRVVDSIARGEVQENVLVEERFPRATFFRCVVFCSVSCPFPASVTFFSVLFL